MNKYDKYDLSILIRMIQCDRYYWSLTDGARNDLINSFCGKMYDEYISALADKFFNIFFSQKW